MQPRSVVRSFENVHKFLEVVIVYTELTIGVTKLVESEGSNVLVVWDTEVAIEGCEEGGKAFKQDL